MSNPVMDDIWDSPIKFPMKGNACTSIKRRIIALTRYRNFQETEIKYHDVLCCDLEQIGYTCSIKEERLESVKLLNISLEKAKKQSSILSL